MQEVVGLSKTVFRNGVCESIELNEEERSNLLDKLRESHKAELRECLEDAREVIGVSSPNNLVRAACALFERRAIASYSVWQEALSRRERELRSEPEALFSTECSECGDELSERALSRGFAKCFLCFRRGKAEQTA
jgi:hypothetical protein